MAAKVRTWAQRWSRIPACFCASGGDNTHDVFRFLLRFLVVPILILIGITLWNKRRGRERAAALSATSIGLAIGLHVLIALLYTTPWDNYLVATGVWWYDPSLVTGVVLGWVPIEEYTFFILQPILVGVWLVLLSQTFVFQG